MWFLARLRKMPDCEKLPMRARAGATPVMVPPCPPRKFQVAAERMLVEAAQKGLEAKQLTSLMTEKVVTVGAMGEERILTVVGGRSKKFLKIAYDCTQLPVLPYWHPLLELYILEGEP